VTSRAFLRFKRVFGEFLSQLGYFGRVQKKGYAFCPFEFMGPLIPNEHIQRTKGIQKDSFEWVVT